VRKSLQRKRNARRKMQIDWLRSSLIIALNSSKTQCEVN
jgi:hypothetical protein